MHDAGVNRATLCVISTLLPVVRSGDSFGAMPGFKFHWESVVQESQYIIKGQVLSVDRLGIGSRVIGSEQKEIEVIEYVARVKVDQCLKGDLAIGSERRITFWFPNGPTNMSLADLRAKEYVLMFVRTNTDTEHEGELELVDSSLAKLPAAPKGACNSDNEKYDRIEDAIINHIQCVVRQFAIDKTLTSSMLKLLLLDFAKVPEAVLPSLREASGSSDIGVTAMALELRLRLRDIGAIQPSLQVLTARADELGAVKERPACVLLAWALEDVSDSLTDEDLRRLDGHPDEGVRRISERIRTQKAARELRKEKEKTSNVRVIIRKPPPDTQE